MHPEFAFNRKKIMMLFNYPFFAKYTKMHLAKTKNMIHVFEFLKIPNGKSISAGSNRWRSYSILLESGSQWMQVVREWRHGKFLLHWEAYSTGACANVSDFYFCLVKRKKKCIKFDFKYFARKKRKKKSLTLWIATAHAKCLFLNEIISDFLILFDNSFKGEKKMKKFQVRNFI